jgi:hypothetical protein
MGVPAIDELGQALGAHWLTFGHDSATFPALCAEHLDKAALHRVIDPGEIVRWVLQRDLPEQFDQLSEFGQPPVTVYRSPRFIIDTLFWLDGTTSIHDHGFSGGFQVLAGSSIETTFSYAPSKVTDPHLSFGKVTLKDSGLRRTGDVAPIVPGSSYIHGLFHLDRPSVTILVRTLPDPLAQRPMQYQPCGIAWNRFFRDQNLDRMVEVIELLDQAGDPRFDEIVGDLVARSDLYAIFRVIRACVDIQDQRRIDALLERVRDRDAARMFATWLAEERTARFLRKRRGLVHEPDLRFLLAVLLNSHRGDHSLRLVSSYTKGEGDPAAHVAGWLRRLSKVTMRLQAGGMPWEPNVLNLPDFEEGFEQAIADTLAKRERAFTPAERVFLDRLRALPHLAPLFAA